MVAAGRRLEPERDPRTGGSGDVGMRVGVREQLAEQLGVGVALDPERELLLGDPQLAEVGRVELRPCLQVLGA